MKRYFLFVGVAISIAGLWFVTRSYHTSPNAQHPTANLTKNWPTPTATASNVLATPAAKPADQRRTVQLVQTIYASPIEIYGRVQDQFGNPVSAAKVEYSVLDRFWEPGTKYTGVSDNNGLFSLTDVKGAAVSVAIWKNGYAGIAEKSNGSFSFGVPFDAQRDRPTPTKDKPAIFVLRKKVEADPLIVANRDIRIPKDGTPVELDLRTAKATTVGHGDLKIECWTSDNVRDTQGHYEWRARISVPGGGLSRRTEPELALTAPESGYEPRVEIAMPQNAERWRRDCDGQYWVKLGNGTFARMRLRITTAGDHFASITSYLNPSGSRNLEYDEAKVIK